VRTWLDAYEDERVSRPRHRWCLAYPGLLPTVLVTSSLVLWSRLPYSLPLLRRLDPSKPTLLCRPRRRRQFNSRRVLAHTHSLSLRFSFAHRSQESNRRPSLKAANRKMNHDFCFCLFLRTVSAPSAAGCTCAREYEPRALCLRKYKRVCQTHFYFYFGSLGEYIFLRIV
jgi:hypothetical protein